MRKQFDGSSAGSELLALPDDPFGLCLMDVTVFRWYQKTACRKDRRHSPETPLTISFSGAQCVPEKQSQRSNGGGSIRIDGSVGLPFHITAHHHLWDSCMSASPISVMRGSI